MEVILVRHGSTEYNRDRRYQGHIDIPLSEAGAAELTRASFGVDKVYVSPLMRARETAGIIFPEAELIPCEGLIEMDFGVFDGRTADEMADDAQYTEWVNGMCQGKCPGGEDTETFMTRTRAAFRMLMDLKNEITVVVAHGGTQMAVMSEFADVDREYWAWQTRPGCGYRAKWDGAKLTEIEEVDYRGGAECR